MTGVERIADIAVIARHRRHRKCARWVSGENSWRRQPSLGIVVWLVPSVLRIPPFQRQFDIELEPDAQAPNASARENAEGMISTSEEGTGAVR